MVLPYLVPSSRHAWPETPSEFRVVGLLSSSSGLGKSARLCIDALEAAGYGVAGVNVASLYDSDDRLPFRAGARRSPAQVSIYHLNPPMLLPGILRANPSHFLRTFNVGYWAWELETLPREWVEALRFVDAVLVPSAFCQKAVEPHTDKPVLVVPHPVVLRAEPAGRRGDGRFRAVSVFNFGSSFERKNPLAAVRAFVDAFGSDDDAELILKVSDGDKYPGDRARLMEAIGGAGNVSLVDEVWSEERLASFIASADVYVSLHRSEGFGLTLAEAIGAGVPVVATGWSGNTDFCRADLCFAVSYNLVPVRDPHLAYAYTDGAVWAEPNVAHAASQLRQLRNGQDAARNSALKLREHLRQHMASRTYEAAIDQLSRRTGDEAVPVMRATCAVES